MSMNNPEEPKCAISSNNTIPENQTKIGTQVASKNEDYPETKKVVVTKIEEEQHTRRGHDDELVRLRNGVIVDLDGDATTSPRHPTKIVELTAKVWDQRLCVLHCLALQICRWSWTHLHSIHCNCWHCCHFWFYAQQRERERERQCVRVDLAYNVVCVQFVLERERKWVCEILWDNMRIFVRVRVCVTIWWLNCGFWLDEKGNLVPRLKLC